MRIINHENAAMALHAAIHFDAAQGIEIPAAIDVIRALRELSATDLLTVSPPCEGFAKALSRKSASNAMGA